MANARRHTRLALAAVAFALFVETIDVSIVSMALPAIAQEFDAPFTRVQWVALVSAMIQASLSLMIGAMGDMFGNKRVLVWGLVLAGVGNVLSAVAPSLLWLILARVVQAIGLTMSGALLLAIVVETFPAEARGKAFGFIGTMVSIGIVVGPLAGGVILKAFHWRLVFLFDLLFVIPALPLAHLYLGGSNGTGRSRFDIIGVAVFFASLCTFLLGTTFNQEPDLKFLSPYLMAASVVCLGTFVLHELRVNNPILNLNLFRSRPFSVYLSARYLYFFVYGGVGLILPFYLEVLMGLDPLTVGVLLSVQPVAFGIGSWMSGELVEIVGKRPLILGGLGLMVVAYAWLGLVIGSLEIWHFTLQMVLLGLGGGLLQPAANSIITSRIPQNELGMVSSLTAVVRIHSRSLGIAALGGLWVYSARLREQALPAGIADLGQVSELQGFAIVCLTATLIAAATTLVCAGESVLRRRMQTAAA